MSTVMLAGCAATTPTPSVGAKPTVHQVSLQKTLSGTDLSFGTITCPAGEIALSGGWIVPDDGSSAKVYHFRRNGTGGWSLLVMHTTTTTVTAYIECLKNAPTATIVERSSGITVPANGDTFTNAACNAGEVVVGGAFDTPPGLTLYNFLNDPPEVPAKTWHGRARNVTAAPIVMGIYVECLTLAGASSSSVNLDAYTFGSPEATSTCPNGTYVSGGGYSAPQYGAQGTMSMFASGKTWHVTMHPMGPLGAIATCLTFG
jgi:hypothetical protein